MGCLPPISIKISDRLSLLTQEFLALMLGVRRAGVSETMGRLQARGLIEYERGLITVVDRAGLDEASCACYRLIRREYDRLLTPG